MGAESALLTLGPMIGGTAAGLYGAFGDFGSGNEYLQQAMEEYIKAKIPDPEQQRIALERYRSAGELSPELEHSIKADPSAFEQITQNAQYADAQNKALSQLQSLGEEGGLSLSDKAALQQQLATSANKDKANRDAITDEMARRGQGGSGMALQAQLAGSQSAGDRDAMARLQTLGSARDRALQAISQGGDLAGKLQSQDYQRQSDMASARDRIAQFNTQNAQSVQQRNVGARNDAQRTNLAAAQQLSNQNVDLGNKEQQYNKGLQQQQFENQMQLAGGKAGIYTGEANNANAEAQRKRQAWGAIASGMGQAGASAQNQGNWDKLFAKKAGG